MPPPTGGEHPVEAVLRAVAGMGAGDVGPGQVGLESGRPAAVDVGADRDGRRGVRIDGPALDPHAARGGGDGLEIAEDRSAHLDRATAQQRVLAPAGLVDAVDAHLVAAVGHGDRHVEAVVDAEVPVGVGDVGSGDVGGGALHVLVVDVDVDLDGGRRVGIDRIAPNADPASGGLDGRRDPPGRPTLEAGPVVEAGVVVGGGGGAALVGVEVPGRGAGDDPAHDGADALDLVVALPVAELGAPRLAVVAVALGAATLRPAARALADPVAAAAAPVAGGIAVVVVPRARSAEPGTISFPPAGNRRVGRARVLTEQRAAELGVAVAAQRAAVAVGAAAVADRGVGGLGSQDVVGRTDGHGRSHHGRAGQELPAGVELGQRSGRPIDQAGHRDTGPKLSGAAAGGRAAARVAGRTVSTATLKVTPRAMIIR